MNRIKTFIFLNILLMVYSIGGICSKAAARTSFLSFKFILCYGALICILAIYAIGWQQVIKKLPLTTAFANKAVTVAWGLIWGVIFFEEEITIGKIIGIVLIMIGIVLFAGKEDEVDENE